VGTGSTDLWGGVERGAQLLVQHRRDGFNSRLFLFSDGLVNQGERNKEVILHNVSTIYERDNIQVSSFGLGDDFDEELMKGIAECGVGAYFFIGSTEAIPDFVDFALKSIQKTVGTDAMLMVRGVNSGLILRFYGHQDVVKGARLGDLRADNVRSVLAQLEVRGDVQEDEQAVMTCELVYHKMGQKEVVMLPGSLILKFTEDVHELESGKSAEVTIKVVVQETAQIDRELVKLMAKKKTKKAIELQERQIKLLEGVVDMDTNLLAGQNKVEALLKLARESLKKLKKEGVTKNAQKEVHHREYMKTRGCEGYTSSYLY